MEIALGVLGWTPDSFWNSTYREFSCAVVGYRMKQRWDAYLVHVFSAMLQPMKFIEPKDIISPRSVPDILTNGEYDKQAWRLREKEIQRQLRLDRKGSEK